MFSIFADLPQPGPVTVDDLAFDYFIPPGGDPASFPAATPPTFDKDTLKFYWNTANAPLGIYRWHLTASAQGFSDSGLLSIVITEVPEPSAIVLLGLAIPALAIRRRQADQSGRM